MDTNIFRLMDVFITGPLQIIVSNYITKSALRYFMLITGILNIIYNGHNFLLFESVLKKPLPILNKFIHLKNGKHQLHRLYNLIIMYPVFTYVLLNIVMPFELRILLLINIVIGFLYNLYYYININRSDKCQKQNVDYLI
jgi:uncharacterized protein YhhL (DUF1145 family)